MHPAYEERRWIVEQPDGSPGGLPWSWAVPEENYTGGGEDREASLPANEGEMVWTGVTELLHLAKICSVMSENQPEEADNQKRAISNKMTRSGGD